MKILIIGTSKITASHIKVLRKKKIQIVGLSSTRKKSKNLIKISKKFHIKKTFTDWKSAIDYAAKIKNCNFLITSRIEDNLKILKYCMKTNKNIFIEKPVFLKSNQFRNILAYKKKIFVGYNRIFYKSVMFLKKKLVNKRSLNVIVKCPEESKLDIIKNSCHIISILLFIFGKLKLKRKIISKNFINNHLVGKNGLNINIFFNFKSADNFSIEVFDKKIRYLLNPIENLKVYRDLKVISVNNNSLYKPKISLELDEYKFNHTKPGFETQLEEFIRFCKGRKIVNDIVFGKEILKICEKLF